jgi:hypothetical protein
MASEQIERAAAHYARITAVRAVHGYYPAQDAAADAKIWATTPATIKDSCIKTVEAILESDVAQT